MRRPKAPASGHAGRLSRAAPSAIALGLATAVAASPAAAAHPTDVADEVVLRDGRRVRGRVTQKDPGRWVVIETRDGIRRTFAWDVVAEIDIDPDARRARSTTARNAWRARAGGKVSYEVRAMASAAVLPKRTYGLTGFCATGTGVAPASIYGQSATDRGRAVGAGLGARVGYMHVAPLEPDGSSSWWALRVATGLDLQLLHAQVPIGIRPFSGELCSEVAKNSHTVESAPSSLLLGRFPLTLGAHLGIGGLDDLMVWRGVVLGLAWSPSYTVVIPWRSGGGGGHLTPLGFELTFDFTTLHASLRERSPESHFRISVSVDPSIDGSQPTTATLGLGLVWY